MKTAAAMRCTMLRRLPSPEQRRARPPLVGILQRESGPYQRDKRNDQKRMFHALEGQHAHVGAAGEFTVGRASARRRRRPQAQQLADPIAAVMQSISPMVTGIISR